MRRRMALTFFSIIGLGDPMGGMYVFVAALRALVTVAPALFLIAAGFALRMLVEAL